MAKEPIAKSRKNLLPPSAGPAKSGRRSRKAPDAEKPEASKGATSKDAAAPASFAPGEKTLVTLLLDRSGSMSRPHEQTVTAINAYLTELRASPADIRFGLVLFDSIDPFDFGRIGWGTHDGSLHGGLHPAVVPAPITPAPVDPAMVAIGGYVRTRSSAGRAASWSDIVKAGGR